MYGYDPTSYNGTEEYTSEEINGFKFTVRTCPVSYVDENDLLGKYTDHPNDPDAVDRKYRGMDRDSLRYFEPMNSLEEHRKDLYESGYTKHQAYEIAKSYVLRDYRYAEDVNNGEASLVDVCVRVLYKGRELAYILTNTDLDNLDEYLLDLYSEVMDEAIEFLTDLDSKPKTLAKAKKVSTELSERAKAAYKKNVHDQFMRKIRSWRDMSMLYQDNHTVTRHAWKHIQNKRIAYYRIR